jgi:hypothetical protein
MSILSILLIIVIVGVIVWAVNAYVPMDAGFKKLFNVAAIVLTIVWLCYRLGVFSELGSVTVPRI